MKKSVRIPARAALTFLGYFATVAASLAFSNAVWPEGLADNAQFMFWPASGVALLFALRFGPAYAPAILLAVIPAVAFADEPPLRAGLGAMGNLLETWTAWFVLVRIARFEGRIDSTRAVAGLTAATMLGGGVASLSYPLLTSLSQGFASATWDSTLIRYTFANSTGSIIVVAAFYALRQTHRRLRIPRTEFIVWLLITCIVSGFVFNAVFADKLNYAFLLFPLVLYAAVRFGSRGCAAALVLVLAGVAVSLARHGASLEEAEVIPVIQFLPGFVWVLSVTGLYIAALVGERRMARQGMLEEKNRSLEARLHAERARLEALRYQINPHFLFNALNAASSTLPPENRETRGMLASIGDYLRTVLAQPPSDLQPLGVELDTVRQYIDIERERFGDALGFAVDCEPAARDVPVPVWMLQPLVENAIRYGLDERKGGLHLRITARVVAGRLHLEVFNQGDWEEDPQGLGIGLNNIRRRLKLLYAEHATLQVDTETGGVRVVLDLPLDPDKTDHESADSG